MRAAEARAPISLKNILYATDFSPSAEAAAPYAAGLARSYGSIVHALHVRPVLEYGIAPPESWPALKESADIQAKQQAEHLTAMFQGTESVAIVEEGDVWDVIARLVEEKHIDLIAMGTHGREGISKIVLGSVAEGVLRRAPCPVLTVGPNVRTEPARAMQMKRILYATDFSAASESAAPYAISLAQENQAQLDVVHVMARQRAGDFVLPQELTIGTVNRMRALLPPEAELWCQPNFLVEAGDPAEEILRVAEQGPSDVVVLGAKRIEGTGSAAGHLPWATAHKVISRALCPVLTVRG